MKTSIIIATYNQDTAQNLIETTVAQANVGEYQLLVCDDGSKLEIVKKNTRALTAYLANGGEIGYVWQSDLGFRLARSRNNALAGSTGDNIIFYNGDETIDDHFLERYKRYFSERVGKILLTGPRYVRTPTGDKLSDSEFFRRKLLHSKCGYLGVWAYNIGTNATDIYFDKNYIGYGIEDLDYAAQLDQKGVILANIEENRITEDLSLDGLNNPFQKRSMRDIVLNARNLLYFLRKFPEARPELGKINFLRKIKFEKGVPVLNPFKDSDVCEVEEEISEYIEKNAHSSVYSGILEFDAQHCSYKQITSLYGDENLNVVIYDNGHYPFLLERLAQKGMLPKNLDLTYYWLPHVTETSLERIRRLSSGRRLKTITI